MFGRNLSSTKQTFQATPGEKEGKVTQRLFKFGFDHFWSVLLQVDVLSLGLRAFFACHIMLIYTVYVRAHGNS